MLLLAHKSTRAANEFGHRQTAYLSLGFIFQIAGYVAEADGAHAESSGTRPAVTFVASTVIALGVALLAYDRVAPGRTRALALAVTQLDGEGLPQAEPSGKALMDLGVELGDDARDDESYGDYARRVWAIERVAEADVVPDEHARRRLHAGPSVGRHSRIGRLTKGVGRSPLDTASSIDIVSMIGCKCSWSQPSRSSSPCRPACWPWFSCATAGVVRSAVYARQVTYT